MPSSTELTIIDHTINITLKENSTQLNQVTITADQNWSHYYEDFVKHFLGTTAIAGKCRILNKDVLHFHFNKQTHILTARADELLLIDNQELGYKIKHLLDAFEFNSESGIIKYQGYPSFEDLKPQTSKQTENWSKNRIKAYNGSIRHFIKSIFDGTSYQQGFYIYSTDMTSNIRLMTTASLSRS